MTASRSMPVVTVCRLGRSSKRTASSRSGRRSLWRSVSIWKKFVALVAIRWAPNTAGSATESRSAATRSKRRTPLLSKSSPTAAVPAATVGADGGDGPLPEGLESTIAAAGIRLQAYTFPKIIVFVHLNVAILAMSVARTVGSGVRSARRGPQRVAVGRPWEGAGGSRRRQEEDFSMTRPDDPRTAAARVFAEGGAFGELLAGIEWAATPLGPPESWPGPLVDTLRLMLTSEHGMALYWGAEFATLYNLGATPIRRQTPLGARQALQGGVPRGLGPPRELPLPLCDRHPQAPADPG